ncbi:T9SS type A sorting domain-containing protein [Rubricoccus marinus]|uniref:FTP domain-containing protein n=1 Tax=Rubricoccus marinus TaxID=716817 RepID=A0A259TY30_9BACT|nr:T9SS type A sorting domain-containing protein [Rubricoccus marinus]OZC02600.1 hypothetical protein BSZ36_06190 [Rubricoccus marinus]
MSFRHSCFLLAALIAAAPAWAQKPRNASALELGADPTLAEPFPSSTGQASLTSSRAVALYRQNAVVRPAAPEAMAREFLSNHESLLGLQEADFEVTRVREGDVGAVVRFHQTVGGVPVWGTETMVNIDKANRVQTVFNGARDIGRVSTDPTLASGAARATAFAHLGVTGTLHYDETNLVIWPGASGARLAWQVRVEAEAPRGDWEAIVDAQTGELLRVADRLLTHRGEDDPTTPLAMPTVETHPLYKRLDATGFIFDPNPLTRAKASYGGGYVDGGDANTPQLEAARSAVTLRDITQVGSRYELKGPWAESVDWDSPREGTYGQSTPEWNFTRDNDAFEAATVYWHIDNYMRYINETLGVPAVPQAYSSGVQFDSKGWNGADNSSFSSGSDRLTFGHGCVDDSEDADVILHELGHGLHDWLASISQQNGLSEGFGDYVAVSYSRGLGLIDPASPPYNWVFKWDGHNECWNGRSTAITSTFPAGNGIHAQGQHFSTSLMRVWDVLGRERTDKAVFEGMTMTTGSTTHPQAAQAIMQAAANLGYSHDEIGVFYDSFVAQGYNGLTRPAATAGEEGPDLASGAEFTAPAPNPFMGTTQVELRVDDAQSVTVKVYDTLGRQVTTLLDEVLVAGRRYPITLDGRGLDAGVYVLVARGETFQRSQRVTLTR